MTRGLLLLSLVLGCLCTVSHLSHASEPVGDEGTFEVERIQREREEKNRFFRWDPRPPLRPEDQRRFRGLAYYPVDPGCVFSGPLERNSSGKTEYVRLPTSKGNFRTYVRVGTFRFRMHHREFSLAVYRFVGRSTLFLPFRDKTNGHETYENGRYVDVRLAGGDMIVVDFNSAHNPYCAYNPKYTCAFAPEENVLDTAVRCGEKTFLPLP
ncbi:MAG: DUF1684 domain-containing protein [Deltaproteobacteria bacterium]|nr:DUF1684 domain-containing protein [Deltaproteobacteria bacterium]